MKWLTGSLRVISEAMSGGGPKPEALEELAALNPERIYVENVRSILNVSHARARRICETAVRRGMFRRQVLVLCPDGSVGASAPDESQLPPRTRCWVEVDGNLELEMQDTADLKTLEVFSFVSSTAH